MGPKIGSFGALAIEFNAFDAIESIAACFTFGGTAAPADNTSDKAGAFDTKTLNYYTFRVFYNLQCR